MAGDKDGKGTARPKTAGKHGGTCLVVRLSGFMFEVLVCQAMVNLAIEFMLAWRTELMTSAA